MSTRENEWTAVRNLYKSCQKKVIPCFGIHPWYAHQHNVAQITTNLRKILVKDEISMIGEVGLDKAWVPKDTLRNEFDKQVPIFEAQLKLAIEFKKPISVHCVRAFGPLYDILKNLTEFPKAIIMHAYSGSVDMMKTFLMAPNGLGKVMYFSFSMCINGDSEKTKENIKFCPSDKLLLETDQNTVMFVDEDLLSMLQVISELKGWELEETATITRTNTMKIIEK